MRAFDPWIGPRYWTSGHNGLRILVLGESQYDAHSDDAGASWSGAPTPNCKESTTKMVQELAIDNRNKFFTKITKLILNKPAGVWISPEERVAFWNEVAFYNYVQWWLRGPRYRPTDTMWLEAQAPLIQLLGELKPHLVLALGNELWTRLPKLPDQVTSVQVPHPSSRGFSYTPWSDKIGDALAKLKEGLG